MQCLVQLSAFMSIILEISMSIVMATAANPQQKYYAKRMFLVFAMVPTRINLGLVTGCLFAFFDYLHVRLWLYLVYISRILDPWPACPIYKSPKSDPRPVTRMTRFHLCLKRSLKPFQMYFWSLRIFDRVWVRKTKSRDRAWVNEKFYDISWECEHYVA